MIKKFYKNEKGISSLLEMMIIIAVLGILISATIANYQGAKNRAQVRRCAAALRNIQNALEIWRVENLGVYPKQTQINSFDTLYTVLSAYSLDINPNEEFADSFLIYTSVTNTANYTLVVKAKDILKTPLTATPGNIDIGNNYKDVDK